MTLRASPTCRASISARSRRRRSRSMPTPPATAGTSTARRSTTPSSATSFAATRMQTDPTGAPAGHYDLLTAIMHEMGHALGLGDSLSRGRPRRADVRLAVSSASGGCRAPARPTARSRARSPSEEFLGRADRHRRAAGGQAVTIQWQATIDPQTNQLIVNPVNTGTVTATNAVGFPDQPTPTPSPPRSTR